MLTNITYYMVFGKPLIMYLGIITLAVFLIAAAIGGLVFKGKVRPPFITVKMHKLFAGIGIILAVIHGILGVLAYF